MWHRWLTSNYPHCNEDKLTAAKSGNIAHQSLLGFRLWQRVNSWSCPLWQNVLLHLLSGLATQGSIWAVGQLGQTGGLPPQTFLCIGCKCFHQKIHRKEVAKTILGAFNPFTTLQHMCSRFRMLVSNLSYWQHYLCIYKNLNFPSVM